MFASLACAAAMVRIYLGLDLGVRVMVATRLAADHRSMTASGCHDMDLWTTRPFEDQSKGLGSKLGSDD